MDYYVGMLSGKFGRKLTERFKRLDTDILNELHSLCYTPKVAACGITLA
ncbi:uncharacterized protein FFFS_01305 [Fusarium fujikuroi]|nr:uncharacterized protein FFFS_01305 [Fusarium fujikuroi]